MLNLDHNDIGDVGATALAEAIRGAPRLEHLGLAANRIRDSGARLADAIGVDGGAAALRRLDLYSNEIGDGGADALGAALDGRNRPRWGGGGAAEFLEVTLFGNPVSASMRARLRGIPGLDLGEKRARAPPGRSDRRGTRCTAAARRTATTARCRPLGPPRRRRLLLEGHRGDLVHAAGARPTSPPRRRRRVGGVGGRRRHALLLQQRDGRDDVGAAGGLLSEESSCA